SFVVISFISAKYSISSSNLRLSKLKCSLFLVNQSKILLLFFEVFKSPLKGIIFSKIVPPCPVDKGITWSWCISYLSPVREHPPLKYIKESFHSSSVIESGKRRFLALLLPAIIASLVGLSSRHFRTYSIFSSRLAS